MGSKLFDFGGYATKNDLLCSDGRTIRRDAFKDNDGQTVPLVWNHEHSSPDNVLGHALLENRSDGVYAYCTFNDTERGQVAKNLVKHKDVVALSIYANKLKQQGSNVLHGAIREVSLVLAGANPGATIDSFVLEHGAYSDEEAVISYVADENEEGLEYEIEHTAVVDAEEKKDVEEVKQNIAKKQSSKKQTSKANKKGEEEMLEYDDAIAHADSEETVQDVFDTLNEKQKTVVYAIIGQALEDAKNETKGEAMKHNVFDGCENSNEEYLSHSEMEAIFSDAKRGGSLKDAVLEHGIEQIDYLFPDNKNISNTPDWVKREDGWVSRVMNAVHRTPFSRIKSTFADIREADARARGYVKGNFKVEEVFTLLKRTTDPQTIYKKQKLDRDDVIDITDFDVVAWLKTEMRGMLNEELARAILVGDGRNSASDDKIKEDHIRPIWTDSEFYTINKTITLANTATDNDKAKAFVKGAIKARVGYKGSGNPTLFTTEDMLTDMLLIENGIGERIYKSEAELATALRVKEIITVPVMENLTRIVNVNGTAQTRALAGIIVNLSDYNIGADKGGAVNMFDDFDIDYNAQKYLIETRCSGAMIRPYSAIAVEFVYGATLTVDPEEQTTTVLGKLVSALQKDDIMVHDTFIQGTLKYVTGYTGYSGDPAEQSGNYIAMKVSAPAGATCTVQLLGGTHAPVTLDSDMNFVCRVTNNKTQKIKLTSTLSGETVTKTYSLAGMTLEEA